MFNNHPHPSQSSTEMSALQRQLQNRRSKVSLKKKKILAMMEDETVIDDPKVKLTGFKKLEVCSV